MAVSQRVDEQLFAVLATTLVACLPTPSLDDAGSSTSVAESCGIWHPDDDGDGFGLAAVAIDTCNPAPHWVVDDRDCYDDNADVRPDQTAFFEVQRGDGGFDYDCDGFATVEQRELGGCYGLECARDIGWRSGLAGCGADAEYVTGCGPLVGEPTKCEWTTESRRQRCR